MSSKRDVELGKASIDTANGYVSTRRAPVQKPVQDTHIEYESDSSDSEDELPITANRHARWWYSIFHNVTAMIGAGVLGLPQAFKFLGEQSLTHFMQFISLLLLSAVSDLRAVFHAGWTGGTIVLALSFGISLWNLWQLCSMHEIKGKRMNRYHELGQYAFGTSLQTTSFVQSQE